jgi:hypothetical protein
VLAWDGYGGGPASSGTARLVADGPSPGPPLPRPVAALSAGRSHVSAEMACEIAHKPISAEKPGDVFGPLAHR